MSAVTATELLALADRISRGEIRALSIQQPWPHHIFHDGKDVENRDWPTKVRGWVIVHAGKKTDGPTPRSLGVLSRGGVVGMMRITDCVNAMESRWFCGKWGFVIGEAFPLPLVPCNGALGFFSLDPVICAEVAATVRTWALI